MTLADDIVELLRGNPKGLTDAELARRLRVPHQAVNQRCRHLETVGTLIRDHGGEFIVNRLVAAPGPEAPQPAPPQSTPSRPAPVPGAWSWEGSVQDALCDWLRQQGWRIVSTADTASHQRGTDVVAQRAGTRLHVEVKGFPSKQYADPRRAGETKPTPPTLQARHWFSGAVHTALHLRELHAADEVAMAFPDFDRYRRLLHGIGGTLRTMRIQVYLIAADGTVTTWAGEGNPT